MLPVRILALLATTLSVRSGDWYLTSPNAELLMDMTSMYMTQCHVSEDEHSAVNLTQRWISTIRFIYAQLSNNTDYSCQGALNSRYSVYLIRSFVQAISRLCQRLHSLSQSFIMLVIIIVSIVSRELNIILLSKFTWSGWSMCKFRIAYVVTTVIAGWDIFWGLWVHYYSL